MKLGNSTSAHSNIISIVILAGLVIATFLFGIIGFSSVYVAKVSINHSDLVRWFDVFYSTLHLFSLHASPADKQVTHWAISLARLTAACTVFFSIAIAGIFAAGSWIKTNVLARFYNNHFVVVGLTPDSLCLITDLLKHNKKVIVVDENHENKLLTEIKKKGVTVVLGETSSILTLLKASILRAKAFVMMTGNDLSNLAVLQTLMESSHQPELQCYIGIDDVTSYKLFEPDAFYSIENIKKLSSGLYINIFNLNEQAAIELVTQINLGATTDIVSEQAPQVSILLVGYNLVAEAVLRELLLMSHFCNQKKVKIVILSPETIDFFNTHHQVAEHCNGKGLDLWDLEFVDDEKELLKLSSFDHIVTCYENERLALSTILRFYDQCTTMQMREQDETTSFHYFSAQKHDIKHNKIKAFGAVEYSASYQQLILGDNEQLAKKSHESYAKTELDLTNASNDELNNNIKAHDKRCENANSWLLWVNQPLFKRRSNFTEKRHFSIKLNVLGGTIPKSVIINNTNNKDIEVSFLPYLDEFTDLNLSILQRWFSYIVNKTNLTQEQLILRIHQLAKSEHDRWNAFHIVNNWRYGTEKNEKLKTHDCLLSWNDLEKLKPETIKYDYRNIYHIAESLALLNNPRSV